MAKQWRCFHCDEVFKTRAEAHAHFGDDNPCNPDVPACIDPLRSDEKARMKELRDAIDHGLKMQREVERADDLEWRLEQIDADLRHYFGQDCSSVWQAGDRYKSALNRVNDLELETVAATLERAAEEARQKEKK